MSKQSQAAAHNLLLFWLKIAYTLLAFIILPVYWYKYGPANFLWFSDIAFFAMVPALWFKNRLISSMMAIGVLPLEILWLIGVLTGGSFLGLGAYMFDSTLPLWLRSLSLFHFPLPVAIIYMLRRYGYDDRAVFLQIPLSLFVIYLAHKYTIVSENVNMIYPPKGFEQVISAPLYSVLMPIILIAGVIIPMHFLLKKICAEKIKKNQND